MDQKIRSSSWIDDSDQSLGENHRPTPNGPAASVKAVSSSATLLVSPTFFGPASNHFSRRQHDL
jgi:hypothetical protein